jgi:hypothetical protein
MRLGLLGPPPEEARVEASGDWTLEASEGRRIRFRHQGAHVFDLERGRKYEFLSGTESNLARHGRRMAGEFFRMLTF